MDKSSENVVSINDSHLTHYLIDPEYDPILKKAKEVGLNNAPEDKVKLFFVPCYLDGKDGIFDKTYYDMNAAKRKEAAPATPPAPPAPTKEEMLLTEIRDLLKK